MFYCFKPNGLTTPSPLDTVFTSEKPNQIPAEKMHYFLKVHSPKNYRRKGGMKSKAYNQ